MKMANSVMRVMAMNMMAIGINHIGSFSQPAGPQFGCQKNQFAPGFILQQEFEIEPARSAGEFFLGQRLLKTGQKIFNGAVCEYRRAWNW
jgi:hypothetical protein